MTTQVENPCAKLELHQLLTDRDKAALRDFLNRPGRREVAIKLFPVEPELVSKMSRNLTVTLVRGFCLNDFSVECVKDLCKFLAEEGLVEFDGESVHRKKSPAPATAI